MEFNIRKGATLPIIEVDLTKGGKTNYNNIVTDLENATIYFYMKNIDDGVYKIASSPCTYDSITNTIYFQFTKKNTSLPNRYEGEFKIETDQGLIDLPLSEKLFINVLESISNGDFCCK